MTWTPERDARIKQFVDVAQIVLLVLGAIVVVLAARFGGEWRCERLLTSDPARHAQVCEVTR